MAARNCYLMCEPDHFQVHYVINPWMNGNLNGVSAVRGRRQWNALYQVVAGNADVRLVKPRAGLPDMTFTANAGFVLEDKVALSRFYHSERRGEELRFEEWFTEHGFTVLKTPQGISFEGAGDALLDRNHPRIWAGYGWRTLRESHEYLRRWFGLEVVSLRLVDGRFYHLDTCFCPLEGGAVMYYPRAFDETSRKSIERRLPADQRIVVSDQDAINFACNAVNIERLVILSKASSSLIDALGRRGFAVVETGLTEFLKAGGAAKCLTLRLNEPRLDDFLRPAPCHLRENLLPP